MTHIKDNNILYCRNDLGLINRWCLGTSLIGTLTFLTEANAPNNGWEKFQSYQKPRRIMPQYKRNVPG